MTTPDKPLPVHAGPAAAGKEESRRTWARVRQRARELALPTLRPLFLAAGFLAYVALRLASLRPDMLVSLSDASFASLQRAMATPSALTVPKVSPGLSSPDTSGGGRAARRVGVDEVNQPSHGRQYKERVG